MKTLSEEANSITEDAKKEITKAFTLLADSAKHGVKSARVTKIDDRNVRIFMLEEDWNLVSAITTAFPDLLLELIESAELTEKAKLEGAQ